MSGTAPMGLGVLAVAFVYAVLLVRWGFTCGPAAPRPAAEHVPAYGAAVSTGLGVCLPCGGLTTVTVHDQVHRCDRGHHTNHTGGTR